MANELNFASGVTGQTMLAKLYQAGAQVGSDITMTEVSSAGGVYSGNMPAVGRGDYYVTFVVGGAVKGQGSISWDGEKEVTPLEQVSEASGYVVRTKVRSKTTSGLAAQVKVLLLKHNGELVDLHTLDPDATCSVSVIRDGGTPQFDLDETDMGSPTTDGWFEADFANPNFEADVGYTAKTTVVADGVTYESSINLFEIW